jgi:hypothetical protein
MAKSVIDPRRSGWAVYVEAGRPLRCPRCGGVHRLERARASDGRSHGDLYVSCRGGRLRIARNHWLDPVAFRTDR